MRPERLTIEGLTCFKDKQELDLRALDLFAIAGPTGAGKSTLLDAITLALYGEVPRVGNHGRTELISSSRDRAVVVLDFAVGADRYRIARTLRRNGGHQVRLERHDGQDFTINLADQVRSVGEEIVKLLGLNAKAFMQSVLLPQGEFARFLKAEPQARRDMLCSLLRLGVYEQMREQAQRRSSSTKATVESLRKVLQEEYGGVDAQALAGLEARHEELTRALEGTRRERDVAQQALGTLRMERLKTAELVECKARLQRLQACTDELEQLRSQLEAARRATSLLPLLDEAQRTKTAAIEAEQQAKTFRENAAAAELQWEAKERARVASEQAAETIPVLRQHVARLHQVLGRLPEAEQLELGIRSQREAIAAITNDLSRLAAAIEASQNLQAEQTVAIVDALGTLQDIGYDANLDAQLQLLRMRAVELGMLRRRAAESSCERTRKQEGLDGLRRNLSSLEEEEQTASAAAGAAREVAGNAEAALHEAHRSDAAGYLRRTLEQDQPCPVCEQPVTLLPQAMLPPEVVAAEEARADARHSLEKAEARARDAQEALARAQAKVAAEETLLATLSDGSSELVAQMKKEERELCALVDAAMAGAAVPVEVWIEARVASLAERRSADERARRQLEQAERARERAQDEELRTRERCAEKEAARTRLEEEHEQSGARFAALREEIAAVATSGDPAVEVEALGDQIKELEAALKRTAAEAADATQRMTVAKEALKMSEEVAARAREEADLRARRRDGEIDRSGFTDEREVRQARRAEAEVAESAERVRKHDQERHAVGERIGALRGELADTRVSEEKLAAAEKIAKELDAAVEKQHGEQKILEEQVGWMRQRLERASGMKGKLEAEERVLRVYGHLAADLRSDKFQAYLLQEAFTELVQGASVRLLSLTGKRYSLLFQDDDIVVVDHDNAGETRISDTLSGGETFLTSLSLALELSDQVQRATGAVRLDSLFIDEGFGTLDPETLALVSEAIQGLRVGGRMVGIITHLPELRDEFAQQILVSKHQGFSTVEVRGAAAAG